MAGTNLPTNIRVVYIDVAVVDVTNESLFELLGVSLSERGPGLGDAFQYHYYELGT